MKKIMLTSVLLLFGFIMVSCNRTETNDNNEPPINEEDKNDDKEPITVLDDISDYATEETRENLVLESDLGTFTYTSSMPELYVIDNGVATVNKVEQNHREQTVEITVELERADGTKDTHSKEIVVGPIVYPEMNSTPIASYFNSGALSRYYPYSEHYQATGDVFTTLVKNEVDMMYYAFISPRADGTVSQGSPADIAMLKQLKAHNVRVLLVVDGVSKASSDAFKSATRDDESIANFVNNIMDVVELYGMDGVDIDWEPFNGGTVPDQLDQFMYALRAEMELRQAEGGSPYILSAALPASDVQLNMWYNLNNLAEVVDHINFMSYDFHHATTLVHVSPINAITRLIDHLKRIDFPLEKAIMGSATYGKAYRLDNKGIDNPYRSTGKLISIPEVEKQGSFASGTLYYQAIQELLKDPNYVIHHQYEGEQLNGSYIYNKTEGIYITFESETSAKEKMDIIHQYPGMGIMSWAYAQDANNVIMDSFIFQRLLNQSS